MWGVQGMLSRKTDFLSNYFPAYWGFKLSKGSVMKDCAVLQQIRLMLPYSSVLQSQGMRANLSATCNTYSNMDWNITLCVRDGSCEMAPSNQSLRNVSSWSFHFQKTTWILSAGHVVRTAWMGFSGLDNSSSTLEEKYISFSARAYTGTTPQSFILL